MSPWSKSVLSYGLIQSLWSKKLITSGQTLARKLPVKPRDQSVYSQIKAFVWNSRQYSLRLHVVYNYVFITVQHVNYKHERNHYFVNSFDKQLLLCDCMYDYVYLGANTLWVAASPSKYLFDIDLRDHFSDGTLILE